jgi:hypothetical protein
VDHSTTFENCQQRPRRLFDVRARPHARLLAVRFEELAIFLVQSLVSEKIEDSIHFTGSHCMEKMYHVLVLIHALSFSKVLLVKMLHHHKLSHAFDGAFAQFTRRQIASDVFEKFGYAIDAQALIVEESSTAFVADVDHVARELRRVETTEFFENGFRLNAIGTRFSVHENDGVSRVAGNGEHDTVVI